MQIPTYLVDKAQYLTDLELETVLSHWNMEGLHVFEDESEMAVDTIVGLYWYCADNHGGQTSDLYSLLSMLGDVYKPGLEAGPCPGSIGEMVKEELENLISRI